MDTPWWTRGVGQEAADKLRNVVQAAVPLRVASRPEDIAEVVTFLAGPGSRHMTRAIVPADAGFHVLVPITPADARR
jgi:3-oxoacyl-[acyl-carrier protein] reductase